MNIYIYTCQLSSKFNKVKQTQVDPKVMAN